MLPENAPSQFGGPADRADVFAGFCLHIDGVDLKTQHRRQMFPDLRFDWPELGFLGEYRQVNVDDAPPLLAQLFQSH